MKFKKIIAAATATISLISTCCINPIASVAEAEGVTYPSTSYNLNSYLRKKSFLTTTDNGYMRVYITDSDNDKNIKIEYYDKDFNITSKKVIPRELEYWGGFFEGENNYFIVEGQNNKDEIDSREVVRVNKYDKNWNKLGTAGITGNTSMFGGDIGYPFDYGSVEMTELNGKLYIATGHDGYVDESVGQGHQGLLLLMVDESTMVGEIADCDLWHSFSQYLTNDGSNLYLFEESEGSEMSLLTKYNPSELPAGYFDSQDTATILKYGGQRTSAWAVATNATCDGITLSQNNILTLGTSIDQSKYGEDSTYNIYLGVTPKNNVSTDSTSTKWLTSITDGSGVNNVSITKINDNRFMVSYTSSGENYWSDFSASLSDYNDPLSANNVHYIFIDGNGNKLSDEYTINATYSDCRPIYDGSDVVFYSSNRTTIDFYKINATSGEFNKKVYNIIGDGVTWNYENGVLTVLGSGEMNDLTSDSFSSESWPSEFYDKVTKIVIKGTVTKISDQAFAYFSNLKEVVLEYGVKSIGKEAFYRCDNLESVTIPSSVTEIGEDIIWTGSWWVSDNSHVYNATLYVTPGSYAETYAGNNDINIVYVYSTETISFGDLNGDGKIDSKDAVIILKTYAQSIVNNSVEYNEYADINKDGKVDSKDAVIILKYYAASIVGNAGNIEDYA